MAKLKENWPIIAVVVGLLIVLVGAFYMGHRELEIEERKVDCLCNGKAQVWIEK